MSKLVKGIFSVLLTGMMVISTGSIASAASSDDEVTKPEIVSIDANQDKDGKVTFEVNAKGGKGGNNLLFYKFYKLDKDGNKIAINQNKHIGQNYSTDNTYTCDLDSDNAANICVEVENSNNDTVSDTKEYKASSSDVKDDKDEKTLKITKFTSDVDEDTTVDSVVNLSAEVSKTNIDEVNYKFIAIDSDENETTIKNSTKSTAKWTPSESGDFTLRLIATDSTGKVKDTKDIQVNIKDKEVKPPVEKEDLSVTLTAQKGDYYVNSPINLTALAKGGEGEYKYKFAYDASYGTDTIQKFGDNSEVEFTPDQEGTYIFYVYVKDSEGTTIKSKTVTVSVKKKEEKPGDSNQEQKPGDSNEEQKPGDSNEEQKPGTGNEEQKPGDGSDNTDKPTGDLSKGIVSISILGVMSLGYIVASKKKSQN